jgi:hypothetical protein
MDIIIHEHEFATGDAIKKLLPIFDEITYYGTIVIQRRAEQNEKNNRDKCEFHGNNTDR